MKLGKILISFVIVSMLVSMTIPLASAPPNHPCEPWPECKGGGGEEPPADPVIAYSAGRDWTGLWVMNADGSRATEVFNAKTIYPQAHVGAKSWSPDGGSIVFIMAYELWIVDVTVMDDTPQGSNARMLWNDCYNCMPAWSPAGDEIAFLGDPHPAYRGSRALYTIPATGGTPETLYSAPEGRQVGHPAWSPDASQIAFVDVSISGGTSHSIKILDRVTKTITRTLYDDLLRLASGSLDWSRAGDRLAFYGLEDYGAPHTIHTMEIDTETTTKIYVGAGPSWSPDDTKLVFTKEEFVNQKKKVYKIEIVDLATLEIDIIVTGSGADWKR